MSRNSKYLILEYTEFNLQRFNPDTSSPAIAVPDKQLSLNAFDKHEDIVRQAIAKIGAITGALSSTAAYQNLKSKLSLESQDVKSIRIIRITKSNNLNYDVYISYNVNETEYWGVVKNILNNPELVSEIFKDNTLVQTKEWVIKIKGVIIKLIKNWLKPQFGKFKLINNEIICYSSITGKMLKLKKDVIIEVLKAYDGKIIFEYEKDQYTLIGDNFIYFNYWFEKIN